ncbi:hypothetical protein PR048_029642 [Dryococelus australis]|uniref:Uncharacterized protein n=1 Tax=Dryococelus australis TaxID=614101 RepID=A0ABQ9GDY1_9NEOP|nr:hypothetical protein PR048_029642 [Dryococelus australis]
MSYFSSLPPSCSSIFFTFPSILLAAVILLASHQGEPGSITGLVTPGFSEVGIVPDNAAGRRVFSGISRFPPALHSSNTPDSPLLNFIGFQDPIGPPQTLMRENLFSSIRPPVVQSVGASPIWSAGGSGFESRCGRLHDGLPSRIVTTPVTTCAHERRGPPDERHHDTSSHGFLLRLLTTASENGQRLNPDCFLWRGDSAGHTRGDGSRKADKAELSRRITCNLRQPSAALSKCFFQRDVGMLGCVGIKVPAYLRQGLTARGWRAGQPSPKCEENRSKNALTRPITAEEKRNGQLPLLSPLSQRRAFITDRNGRVYTDSRDNADHADFGKYSTPNKAKKCSIPGGVAPGFSCVGIVPDAGAAGRRVFLGALPFPPLLHTLVYVKSRPTAAIVYSLMYEHPDINCTLVVCCHSGRRQLGQPSPGGVKHRVDQWLKKLLTAESSGGRTRLYADWPEQVPRVGLSFSPGLVSESRGARGRRLGDENTDFSFLPCDPTRGGWFDAVIGHRTKKGRNNRPAQCITVADGWSREGAYLVGIIAGIYTGARRGIKENTFQQLLDLFHITTHQPHKAYLHELTNTLLSPALIQ